MGGDTLLSAKFSIFETNAIRFTISAIIIATITTSKSPKSDSFPQQHKHTEAPGVEGRLWQCDNVAPTFSFQRLKADGIQVLYVVSQRIEKLIFVI